VKIIERRFKMVGEEYEDYKEDLEDEEVERQQEAYGDQTPAYEKKDDLYSLFWKVVKSTDSSKVGNLKKEELGMLDLSVRDCQKIALLAETLGHLGFAQFFREQGEIILATSASREGWLPTLFVSQRKLKARETSTQNLPQFQQPKKKKGLFRK